MAASPKLPTRTLLIAWIANKSASEIDKNGRANTKETSTRQALWYFSESVRVSALYLWNNRAKADRIGTRRSGLCIQQPPGVGNTIAHRLLY
jgi:hypothetical protein